MSTVNPTMLLRDETVLPTNEVIKKVLGEELFGVYSGLITSFTSELDMEPQWRYYNDGKAWLCKVVYRKKNDFVAFAVEGLHQNEFLFLRKNTARYNEPGHSSFYKRTDRKCCSHRQTDTADSGHIKIRTTE